MECWIAQFEITLGTISDTFPDSIREILLAWASEFQMSGVINILWSATKTHSRVCIIFANSQIRGKCPNRVLSGDSQNVDVSVRLDLHCWMEFEQEVTVRFLFKQNEGGRHSQKDSGTVYR
jgi:hypothetical protein